jgi:hypothetical protein
MAAMTTVLTEFTNSGNSKTSTYSGHTAVKPKLVIEKKRPIEGSASMAEYSFKVVEATEDAEGIVLSSKVSFEATVRYPKDGDSAEITSALAVFRDIVAGDEFGVSVSTLNWLDA